MVALSFGLSYYYILLFVSSFVCFSCLPHFINHSHPFPLMWFPSSTPPPLFISFFTHKTHTHTHQNNHILKISNHSNKPPMMPPQQETSITSNIPAIPNRPENSYVHAEPPSSATNDIKPTFTSNDIHNNNSSQHHQAAPSAPRFSILQQSLRPVTLKVLIINFSSHTNIFIFFFTFNFFFFRVLFFSHCFNI